ncbi:hypothetical protein [Pseudomonas fluorescens]|uniref:Uncharacterized protein n=1 Tax=Pseudomonas fluorescens TaxID=294 RepID=A0A5E7EUG4_PSEFL|nr:hypothetical protein [Pseudomonas fluorescens]VVO30324.1 hypothetical protein PS723_04936 [Pseudomonas fluorescens]
MNTFEAPFAQTPRTNAVVLTAATAIGTAGTVLVTAGPNGCVVTSVRATPNGALTATGVDLNKAGKAFRSEAFAAYTLLLTAKRPQLTFDIAPNATLELGPNETLDVSLLVAQAAGVTVSAAWKDY